MSVVMQNCRLQQERELEPASSPCDVRGSPYYLWPSYDGSTMKFHDLKNRLSVWFNNFLLALICTVVAIGYFVPVIIYIAEPAGSRAALAIDSVNFGNCKSQVSKDNHIASLYLHYKKISTHYFTDYLSNSYLGRGIVTRDRV